MLINPSPMNILDYCNAFISGDIKSDANYQRTDKVWPRQAQQYLIESIILGYPIPKLFLHQKIDIKSKKSLKFVVDGQQRSKAILEFFKGSYPLARNSNFMHLAGKNFDALEEDDQNAFLSYSLPIDLFITASREEIIETFRRINSYTVPLNSEEKRHANFQGAMKWFVYNQANKYSDKLAEIGTFTDKNLARMVDFKFFSEIIYFLVEGGISTINAIKLDKMYAKYDLRFEEAENINCEIDSAFKTLLSWSWFKGLNIVRPHIIEMIVYSLIVNKGKVLRGEAEIRESLSEMSEALETGQSDIWQSFIDASARTTNDGGRKMRIYEAVTSVLY